MATRKKDVDRRREVGRASEVGRGLAGAERGGLTNAGAGGIAGGQGGQSFEQRSSQGFGQGGVMERGSGTGDDVEASAPPSEARGSKRKLDDVRDRGGREGLNR
jgi:hypothetical protein